MDPKRFCGCCKKEIVAGELRHCPHPQCPWHKACADAVDRARRRG